jgi:N-acetylneuraminate synthase
VDELTIAGRRVGPGQPPYVIAEIGANHNGDMNLCRRIVDAAKDCGADAVGFQSWSKESLISQLSTRATRGTRRRIPAS